MAKTAKELTAYEWSKRFKSFIKLKTGKDANVFVSFKTDKPDGDLFDQEAQNYYKEAAEIFNGML